MGKYSDYLPRFGRNRFRNDDEGAARFEHFIDDARARRQKPKSRPALKVVVLAIVFISVLPGLIEVVRTKLKARKLNS